MDYMFSYLPSGVAVTRCDGLTWQEQSPKLTEGQPARFYVLDPSRGFAVQEDKLGQEETAWFQWALARDKHTKKQLESFKRK